MDNPAEVKKQESAYPRQPSYANLHFQDRRKRSPVGNIYPIFKNFFLNML